MGKSYRYKDLSFAVADETEVNVTVEFISDGNSGMTSINIPGPGNMEIEHSGSCIIGKGKNLRGEQTICVSEIVNLIPQVKDIRVHYKINDKLLVEHRNPKSETEEPKIILFIHFPAK